jgi:signal transduction histidine kinase
MPAHPLCLQADYDRLSQVVINLVSNTILYSATQSTISLSISTENERTVLQVHDEGNELSPEQQAQLFEPFYRTSLAEHLRRDGWGSVSHSVKRSQSGAVGASW